MKFNKWTVGLAAVGVVSLTSVAYADESKLSQVNTALSGTTLSGYVDVSAQFNPNGGGGAPNYTFGNKANGINMNVVDIALDKPQDESPWASGYHAELWFGPDANTLGTSSSGGERRSAKPTSFCARPSATALTGKSAFSTPSSATKAPLPATTRITAIPLAIILNRRPTRAFWPPTRRLTGCPPKSVWLTLPMLAAAFTLPP